MEIERKFLIAQMPDRLEEYEHADIVQAYLCIDPVMRIRKHGEKYVFTYKGSGMMMREEYNLPLTGEAFEHLLPKADGSRIEKTRYLIPLDMAGNPLPPGMPSEGLTAELDVFTAPKPLVMAEVEFPDQVSAQSFEMPAWFAKEVTNDPAYHNSNMSKNE
ncbi:MAG: CYTH domain-containing protein [Lachnospiraceae bacterium]|nr:CYTH domain-containing protein [Lachnospiraceae bacterium]